MSENDGRRYPARPVLGVGALLFDEAQRVLLVERGRAPLVGYWSLPGGAVESGERLEQALIREVFEETGLNITPRSIATVFERIMPDQVGACEYHYVLVDFYCSIDGGELRPGDDSKSARWFPLSELSELLMTEGTREVIAACLESGVTCPYVTRP